jgi:hypothetical protein
LRRDSGDGEGYDRLIDKREKKLRLPAVEDRKKKRHSGNPKRRLPIILLIGNTSKTKIHLIINNFTLLINKVCCRSIIGGRSHIGCLPERLAPRKADVKM